MRPKTSKSEGVPGVAVQPVCSADVTKTLHEEMVKRVGTKRAMHFANARTHAIQALESFVYPGHDRTARAIWNLAAKEFRAATTPNESGSPTPGENQ